MAGFGACNLARTVCLISFLVACFPHAGLAQNAREFHLALDGWIAEDGRSVNLTWRDGVRDHRGTVEISRRPLGSVGGATWRPVEVEHHTGMRAVDASTQQGKAYEYRVLRRGAEGITDVGYWVAGRDLAAIEVRGKVHLVVDQSLQEQIAPYIARYRRDLIGDGWRVLTYSMPRHVVGNPTNNLKAVLALKRQLSAIYEVDPFARRHVVVLIGRVPVVTSGSANPDGHQSVPLATDLIYGDMDGRWRATAEGQLLDTRLPSDAIEMQVGRIDFAPLSEGDQDHEIQLLRAYFDKNHNWRHGRLGDLREAYGDGRNLTGEIYGLRNIVGPQAITEGGHHDVGEQRPWLWGVDFGAPGGHTYAERFANKAVFAINFGSHKQKIADRFNAMTALLAQPWYPLTVGWGARPSWWLHHMALGGTIGDVHMRTVNNGVASEPYEQSMDYFPTGLYLWRNPIWVNLLGDPTLRAFPLSPPQRLQAAASTSGVTLSWTPSPDPDVLGYRVYKVLDSTAGFRQISGNDPLTEPTFHDPAGVQNAVYMVRAYGRKEVHAGSFRTLSQGILAKAGRRVLTADDMELTLSGLGPFVLPPPFSGSQEGLIYGFVKGPKAGSLRHMENVWHYTPPDEFKGDVHLHFTVSNGLASDTGILKLNVTP